MKNITYRLVTEPRVQTLINNILNRTDIDLNEKVNILRSYNLAVPILNKTINET